MKAGTITAAIIGAGRVGMYHLKAQTELGSRVVLFDADPKRAWDMARQFHNVTVAGSLEAAVEAAGIVHVCTPPMYHVPAVLASVAQRKPAIVEKPLALNLADAVTMTQAAKSHNVPLMLDTPMRITPSMQQIHQALAGGDIGPVNSLETSYVHDIKGLGAAQTWRKRLGYTTWLYEGGTHAVDLNIWLSGGQRVRQVQAVMSPHKHREDYFWAEDFAINLVYDSGLIGRVWTDCASPQPKHGAHAAVFGSEGAYRAQSMTPRLEYFREGDDDWSTRPVSVVPTMNIMSEIANDFVLGRRADFDPLPDVDEALQLMVVLDTIGKALETCRLETVPALDEVLTVGVK